MTLILSTTFISDFHACHGNLQFHEMKFPISGTGGDLLVYKIFHYLPNFLFTGTEFTISNVMVMVRRYQNENL